MKKRWFFVFIAVMMVLPFHQVFALGGNHPGEIAQAEAMVVSRINEIRARKGIAPLVRLASMDTYAREWCGKQAQDGMYSHRDWNAMQRDIPGVSPMAENVLMWNVSYMTDLNQFLDEGVGWWDHSPTHHANMTNPDYNVAGLGIVERAGVWYVTLNVGYAPDMHGVKENQVDPESQGILEEENNFEQVAAVEEEVFEKLSKEGKVIMGLNYKKDLGEHSAYRALLSDGFIVEGRNDALNGAVKISLEKLGKGKTRLVLLDENDHVVSSKGLVRIYVYLPESVSRPVVIRQDGIEQHLAEVEGSNFVWYTAEL